MKSIQKRMKICISAMLLLLAIAVTCSTASAAGTKSLKLNKKKATLTVGKKLTLKATVKPKNAKVTWSTNKKKVATVSKKGVVKAKKKGKATITAKSGKKKATCKITVKKAATVYNMKSVSVTDSKVIRVTLNKAKALTKANFAVKVKADGKGSYNKTLNIESVQNSGNKVYDLILSTPDENDTNYIEDQDYVSVTCSKLNGVKTKEAIYIGENNPTNVYISGTVGNEISQSVSFSSWLKGYCTYTISKLPAGLKAVKYRNYVRIEGTPTAVSKGAKVTIQAKDEMGKTVTRNVYFYVGNANTLVTYTTTERKTVLSGDGSSEYIDIYTAGGTGSRTLKLTSSNQYITVEYNDEIRIDDKIAAGTYTIKYTVTDSNKKSVSGTFKITVESAVRVTGNVKAMDNSAISSAYVYMCFKDKENKYYKNSDSASSSSKGEYSVYVPASKSYNITVNSSDVYQYHYNVSVGKTAKILDFKLPVYKISLTAANAANKADLVNVSWYDKDNDYIGYGNTLYLKKGTYQIKGSHGLYEYSATITVKGNATVTVAVKSKVKGTLTLNQEQSISLTNYEYYYVQFKPTQSGLYEFSGTSTNNYLAIRLYESSDIDSSINSDSGYGTRTLSQMLESGKTYYLRLYTDEGNATSKVKVTQTTMEALTLSTAKTISVNSGNYKWVSFTPSEDGNYDIKTSAVDTYVYAYLYNSTNINSSINYAENDYYDNYEETPLSMNNCSLSANQTYYIKIYASSTTDMDVTITPTQTETQTEAE